MNLNPSLFGKTYLAIIAIFILTLLPFGGLAGTLDDLKKEIQIKGAEIKKLEEEVERFRQDISIKQKEAKTLKAEIGRIDGSITQLARDINITEKKIGKTELEIRFLELEIVAKELSLDRLKGGLGGLIQSLSEKAEESPLMLFLKYWRISDFFTQLDQTSFLNQKLFSTIGEVNFIKNDLESQKTSAQEKKNELAFLQKGLGEQKKIQQEVKKTRTNLLVLTRNQEKKFQELLKDRERKKELLEQEIFEIEEKIRITIDASSLPKKGSGILGYPLPDVILESCWKEGITAKNCITQYFGNTPFAVSGAYRGKGHNGLDFRADFGTSVFSAERGIIEAVGDTDVGCVGASYGKWVLIRHPNNVSTLYSHLSSIIVSQGQEVKRGEQIGYSGKSGYATGPHLHFGVFATQAIKIESIKSRVCGRLMTLPIAALNGYINPLDYL